jgi:FtsH-binding integral membrane protein
MISVTPLARKNEVAAQRSAIIRAAAVTAAAFIAVTFAASTLADMTGDMLSAFVLALTGLVTLLAILAPRSRSRHGQG